MSFKILPLSTEDTSHKSRRYSNGAGLEIRFWSCYADISHTASGLKLGKSLYRKDNKGKTVLSVKDVISLADKVAALTDWTKSKDKVVAACTADKGKIYNLIGEILDKHRSRF